MARLVGLLELAAEDLIKTDCRYEYGVLVKILVYLLVYTLGLYRYVVEIRLAEQGRA